MNAPSLTPSFESSAWSEEEKSLHSRPTPEVTPGILKGSKGVNFSGEIILDGITPGVHWEEKQFPAWTRECCMPIEQIASIVDKVRQVFGFQFDASVNVFELLMSQLESRASRSDPHSALISLHADYIGGPRANFRQWYFAAQIDVIDRSHQAGFTSVSLNADGTPETPDPDFEVPLEASISSWAFDMSTLSDQERMIDMVIYLSCWCEANQVRFMPECLAFIVKCARDHYRFGMHQPSPDGHFLDTVITPLYECYKGFNGTDDKDGQWIQNERDHRKKIGYDDINQLFWSTSGLDRLRIPDGKSLVELPPRQWYSELAHVDWPAAFTKTFKETRSWIHMVTNFSRIWIVHGSVFWFYTSFHAPSLYTVNYSYIHDTPPQTYVQLTIASLGGLIGPLVSSLSLLGELYFVPRDFGLARPVLPRMLISLVAFTILAVPAIYNLAAYDWSESETFPTVISMILFSLAICYTVYFSVQPLSHIMGHTVRTSATLSSRVTQSNRRFLALQYFTAQFPALRWKDQLLSWGITLLVFAAKLTESYFYLTLSLRDPIRELRVMSLKERCIGDALLGNFICTWYPKILLVGLLVIDMTLFFLDTYLWYVIFNTVVSVAISLGSGVSVWTPWRNAYSRLPQRIMSKIIPASPDHHKSAHCLQAIWESIVDAMFSGHLLKRSQAEGLLDSISNEPGVFPLAVEGNLQEKLQALDGEANRRFSYFAHSLTTPLPRSQKASTMPAFTVLIPHYSEKILLSLKESISVGPHNSSKVTVLEYLQKLHPVEWDCFIKENMQTKHRLSVDKDVAEDGYESAFRAIGFATSHPADIRRTRLWCSMRTQTLFRTVSGFMNYSKALQILAEAETRDDSWSNEDTLRKFNLVVAMQRYLNLDVDELSDVEYMFSAFPKMQMVYVDRDEDGQYFASLVDGRCELLDGLRRRPRLRIRISGNPILGDGKSDNQNHAIVFYRGEYIQLVDANQDNYIEECLKIHNVLMEFDENELPLADPYGMSADNARSADCVAIVGAREYIFSENIGILGDVAAGKEQTFGTLFARTLARIGGKLHYGHPDFLNGIFMTTRGGVSKAQAGLHLNEDIYAGIMAISRGGAIKYSEYYQCGKGRDLGFVSILNFVSKIGAGMGEQMLSREYFYLGTQLPVDRFFSFFYAHPGFHLNNVFIGLSLDMFLIVVLWISSIASMSTLCRYEPGLQHGEPHTPPGCRNILPLRDWVKRCVVSIFIVFFISLCPLFFQELIEKGLIKSLLRVAKHFFSLSALFEVFVCRLYARSFLTDLAIGGARYVATGRTFATRRIPFHQLYEGYAPDCLRFGFRFLAVLVLASVLFWHASYILFWVTSVALCLCPFIYNPHQFVFVEFFLDYRNTLSWLFSYKGEGASWAAFTRRSRAKLTGYVSRKRGEAVRPSRWSVLFSQVSVATLLFVTLGIPYLYIGSQRYHAQQIDPSSSALCRVAVIALAPMVVNSVVLLIGFAISLVGGRTSGSVASAVASFQRTLAVVAQIATWYVAVILNNGNFVHALLSLVVGRVLQRLLIVSATTFLLPRLSSAAESNDAWWEGRWKSTCFGALVLAEFVAKILEATEFACDFIGCHAILITLAPLVLVPYIDRGHTLLLLWLRPSSVPRRGYATSTRKEVNSSRLYCLIFVLLNAALIVSILVPFIVPRAILTRLEDVVVLKLPILINKG